MNRRARRCRRSTIMELCAPAWDAMHNAEAVGVTFNIEGEQLAVSYPLDINRQLWRAIQRDILQHLRCIVGLVQAREELEREASGDGGIDPRRSHRHGARLRHPRSRTPLAQSDRERRAPRCLRNQTI
jgi:hypothetical protein